MRTLYVIRRHTQNRLTFYSRLPGHWRAQTSNHTVYFEMLWLAKLAAATLRRVYDGKIAPIPLTAD